MFINFKSNQNRGYFVESNYQAHDSFLFFWRTSNRASVKIL